MIDTVIMQWHSFTKQKESCDERDKSKNRQSSVWVNKW